MRNVLLAAGVYNVLWGAFAVLFPAAIFDWLGMPQPNYPQFWQCIGMIVGVYGLGYAIAAFDPARHWPIVLVGFLGKVFGPLGMVQALWTGQLPWGFALNCVTNDLIWWVPFALILKHAWEVYQREDGAGSLPDEATLLEEAQTTSGGSLAELSNRQPVLLVLLRHSGCTFCREALADLAVRRAEIEANPDGISLAGPMMEALETVGFLDRAAMLDTGSATFRAQIDAVRVAYDTAMAFVWIRTPGNSRAHQVAAGRDYVRLNLAATAAGVAMQPFSQALQEFPEMAQQFAGMRAALDVGDGETLQMFARLGYGAPVKGAPRWPAGSRIRTA